MTQGRIRSYRDLEVWQRAIDLVEVVYQLTDSFPKHETYGLRAQMRRAAVSIPSNIAEGHGRSGAREYLHHLSIANGSLMELETQVVVSRRLGYLSSESETHLIARSGEVGRMAAGLIRALQRRVKKSPTPAARPLTPLRQD